MKQIVFAMGVKKAEDALLETLNDTVKGEKYSCVGAATHTEAVVGLCASNKPDLLIYKDGLPGSATSIQVLGEVKKASPNTRIIVFTHKREPGDAFLAQLTTWGIYDFIADSPIKGKQMIELIRKPRTFADVEKYMPRITADKNGGMAFETKVIHEQSGGGDELEDIGGADSVHGKVQTAHVSSAEVNDIEDEEVPQAFTPKASAIRRGTTLNYNPLFRGAGNSFGNVPVRENPSVTPTVLKPEPVAPQPSVAQPAPSVNIPLSFPETDAEDDKDEDAFNFFQKVVEETAAIPVITKPIPENVITAGNAEDEIKKPSVVEEPVMRREVPKPEPVPTPAPAPVNFPEEPKEMKPEPVKSEPVEDVFEEEEEFPTFDKISTREEIMKTEPVAPATPVETPKAPERKPESAPVKEVKAEPKKQKPLSFEELRQRVAQANPGFRAPETPAGSDNFDDLMDETPIMETHAEEDEEFSSPEELAATDAKIKAEKETKRAQAIAGIKAKEQPQPVPKKTEPKKQEQKKAEQPKAAPKTVQEKKSAPVKPEPKKAEPVKAEAPKPVEKHAADNGEHFTIKDLHFEYNGKYILFVRALPSSRMTALDTAVIMTKTGKKVLYVDANTESPVTEFAENNRITLSDKKYVDYIFCKCKDVKKAIEAKNASKYDYVIIDATVNHALDRAVELSDWNILFTPYDRYIGETTMKRYGEVLRSKKFATVIEETVDDQTISSKLLKQTFGAKIIKTYVSTTATNTAYRDKAVYADSDTDGAIRDYSRLLTALQKSVEPNVEEKA